MCYKQFCSEFCRGMPRKPLSISFLLAFTTAAAANAAAAASQFEQPEAFRFEDPMYDKGYGMFKAYANSKLALLMFAEELQHRLNREKSTVIVNTANPGTVHTLAAPHCITPHILLIHGVEVVICPTSRTGKEVVIRFACVCACGCVFLYRPHFPAVGGAMIPRTARHLLVPIAAATAAAATCGAGHVGGLVTPTFSLSLYLSVSACSTLPCVRRRHCDHRYFTGHGLVLENWARAVRARFGPLLQAAKCGGFHQVRR